MLFRFRDHKHARRTEPSVPNSGPSVGRVAISAARGIERDGRGSRGGRVTRSTRGRSVAKGQ
jgi:hypothetical protein